MTRLIGPARAARYTMGMYNLILMMSLFPAQADVVTQIQPCVWPRVCAQQAETVAQIQPCVWPRICSQTQAVPSVGTEASGRQADGPVTTCEYPNKCS